MLRSWSSPRRRGGRTYCWLGLHRLSPDGFEKLDLYLLRLYGLELERVGGSGDEGLDGIGTAPLSAVLSSGWRFR